MRELELRDIAGYLPYDLHIMRRAWDEEEEVEVFEEVTSDWIIKYITFDYLIHERCKPILRPMSDIIKPIIVKGYNDDKEFVPIVALAERAFEIEIDAVTGFAQNGKCRGVSFIFDYVEYGFSYSEDTDSFHTQIISPKQNIIADNQSQLFDLLNQWNFDYRNLIAEGLAIDINTLNQ